jgi:hypothetical protein
LREAQWGQLRGPGFPAITWQAPDFYQIII